MGASESKTTINSLSQTISNISMTTVQDCMVSSDQSQTFEMVNTGFSFGGTTRLVQETDVSSRCFSDVSKQTDLQQKLVQAIEQETDATNTGLLGAFGNTTAEAKANLKTIIETNITMSNIQNSYNTIKQTQSVKFRNEGTMLFRDVELVQGGKLFAAAVLKEVDNAGIFSTIEAHVDQKAKSTVDSPFQFVADIVGDVAGTISTGFMFYILLIGGAILLFFYMSRGGSSGQPGAQNYDQSYDQSYDQPYDQNYDQTQSGAYYINNNPQY